MVGRTRTSDSQVTTYTYDFRNRLTEDLIKTSGGVTVQDDKFTYDIQNRRIGKNTLSGGQSWTGYDGVNPYADFNSSGSLTYRYLYGNAIDFLLARVDTSGVPTWYLTDNIGSVREDVNTSGTVLDSITYDSYGNILSESNSSNGDRFKFTGREWDSEIGQYFYRARDYAPGIGRFESEDPLAIKGGDLNPYRYAKNLPTILKDPLGLLAIGLTGGQGNKGPTEGARTPPWPFNWLPNPLQIAQGLGNFLISGCIKVEGNLSIRLSYAVDPKDTFFCRNKIQFGLDHGGWAALPASKDFPFSFESSCSPGLTCNFPDDPSLTINRQLYTATFIITITQAMVDQHPELKRVKGCHIVVTIRVRLFMNVWIGTCSP
jgi:RHS repeat-associated protein